MIRKILIANRSEIAVRIIRAARELDIKSVAVYSEEDASAFHKMLADEAVGLGEGPPSENYLNIKKILEAAKQCGADAIHPGYGFLSERSEFASACEQTGIHFVGPSAVAMDQLGSKIRAKQIAESLHIPLVPGFFDLGASGQDLKKAAYEIGYPIMLKASAGGGGRGMRVVFEEINFDHALRLAKDEARKAFGSDQMMVEKYIAQPRHIEIQLLGDQSGSVLSLFERECSIQRRHQKIIEESPSVMFRKLGSSPLSLMWEEMNQAALRLAKAVGYVGAGTVEFMVDEVNEKFYFLEVNTRLQVEHPVTEAVTGVDLVQAQIRIAAGEKIEEIPGFLSQDRSEIRGHAIEARIVAEDPSQNFLPSIGKIIGWAEPSGPGIRVDTGFEEGSLVSGLYDNLLAKLIVHAPSREEAIKKLRVALMDFHILGVRTNIRYLLDLIDLPAFQEGKFDTGFIEREFSSWSPSKELPSYLPRLLEASKSMNINSFSKANLSLKDEVAFSIWGQKDGWRNTSLWYK